MVQYHWLPLSVFMCQSLDHCVCTDAYLCLSSPFGFQFNIHFLCLCYGTEQNFFLQFLKDIQQPGFQFPETAQLLTT